MSPILFYKINFTDNQKVEALLPADFHVHNRIFHQFSENFPQDDFACLAETKSVTPILTNTSESLKSANKATHFSRGPTIN
jgi:hypothetical protein